MASTTVSSLTSLAPDSIITIPSAVPTTIMFTKLSRISLYVGLMRNWPLTSPKHKRNHLSFAAKAIGKKRPHGAINLPAGENLAFTGTAFALDKAAGNTSTRVGVLAVVNGQREEINSLARVRVCSRRGQHHVIANSHHD